ncbi:hypothetical protein BKA81DRAFT_369706 [Phyllosticta paracitricarpa]
MSDDERRATSGRTNSIPARHATPCHATPPLPHFAPHPLGGPTPSFRYERADDRPTVRPCC